MLHLFTGLDFHSSFMLALALLFVLFYEAINGFHDTANAVATVIYTRALQAKIAVILSGIFNFLGVILGGLSVAYAIVHLLPTDLLLNVGSKHSLAMMFSMLLAAILWNLGTWYFGLPASSSHTLIGSIIGIGLTNALLTHTPIIDALNVPKMVSIFLSLLISPVVGLLIAGAAIFCLRRFWSGTKKRRRIHMTPTEREQIDGKRKPPFWTRIALIMSAIGVSFSHGANDGQKGIGLIMLVLIALAPAGFVMNMSASSYDISRTQDAIRSLAQYYQQHPQQLLQLKNEALANHLANQAFLSSYPSTAPLSLVDTFVPRVNAAEISPLTDAPPITAKPVHFYCDSTQAVMTINRAQSLLTHITDYQQLTPTQREQARRLMMCLADTTDKLVKLPNISADDKHLLGKLKKDILNTVEYAPIWIIVAVALALSLGTMIGWRRVVTTIGEKIGKNDMTYAQGVSAQMTAAVSIGIASYTGMPVSTTHVLSSAVAGTMIADGGGVQSKTVKNILLAWFLTLPMSMLLSGGLYYLALQTFL